MVMPTLSLSHDPAGARLQRRGHDVYDNGQYRKIARYRRNFPI